MTGCEIVMFVSALSCSIAENYSLEQIELLAAIFNQLGDSLDTLMVCMATSSSSSSTSSTSSSDETIPLQ